MCATFSISTMGHYCDGEEDTFRLLKTGIPVVEVAEAEKPRLLQPMDISADRLHYSNKEINNYANPTGRDCAVPKEAAITDSTSTSTANADTTAPAPTTVNSQKTRSTSRLAVPVPPKQKNKVSRPSRTPKAT